MKKLLTKMVLPLVIALGMISAVTAQRTITGSMTDAQTGEPLIGANVFVPGFDVGTIADIDGNYSVDVPAGATTLEFSYTGYTTQTVTIGADNVINVTMSPGELLDEIVVVGYGTQKQKEITGSVASIKSEDFITGNVNSPAQLLQGKVAGLTITRPSGDPNGGVGIRLRGLSTIGAQTNPLIIIDGVPGGSLSNIDPQDIESIDVLKDGSAAAIYGTRGSSGVIIVTTRKGKAGVSKIDYNSYVTTESIVRTPDVYTAEEFVAAQGNDGGERNNWYDEISQAGLQHSHNLSLSGGSDKNTYRASLNFRDADGIVKNSGFTQLNASLSMTQKAMNDKLKVTINLLTTNRKSDFGYANAFRYALLFNPTSRIFETDGSYFEPGGFDVFNPRAIVEQNINDGERNELLGNVYASYAIMDGLKITGSYAKQKFNQFTGQYSPKNALFGGGMGRNGLAQRRTDINFNDVYESTLNYTGESGNLVYTAVAGYSYQEFSNEGQGITAGGYLLDNNTYNQIGSSSEVLKGLASPYSYRNGYKLEAQFGRINLNYDDTYFGSASVRREGSDRFGADNRFGVFSAISAGVDISKLANISGVDNLKARIGYGVTGNLPGSNYLAESIFSPGAQFFYNGEFVPSFGPTVNANPDLKWETKKEINFGVDFALLDFKLTGALDIFSRKTEDLILSTRVPVPPNLADFTNKNVASFTSSGVELAITYNDLIDSDNLNYSPSLIFTSYKSTLDSYLEDTQSEFRTNLGSPGQNIRDAGKGLHLLEVGKPIGQIVAPIFAGVDASGNYTVIDQSTGEAIPINESEDEDWIVVGNGLPDFELSLNNNFSFGKFDANIFLRGVFGHSMVHTNRAFYEINPDILGSNLINTPLNNPAVKNASYNSVHVEDASFLKIDNATVGYTFDMSGSDAFSKARVYIAGQNLVTFTSYTGVDPEVRLDDFGDQLAPGVDRRDTYFTTRSFTFGVNLGF